MVNKYLLRPMYIGEFLRTIDYYAKSLEGKVLPAFSSISEEADKVKQEAYDRLSKNCDPEWVDPADIAESVEDAGISFYVMAYGIVQGLTNLFTAGLYHLFEQQFLKFHRRELLFIGEDSDLSLISWNEAKTRLLNQYGIDITLFASWGKINELRLVANCAKHADGKSCEELKSIRPDLFSPPSLKGDGNQIDLARYAQVFEPLAGDDFYINLDDFRKYAAAVKEFWEELGKAFDKIEDPKE